MKKSLALVLGMGAVLLTACGSSDVNLAADPNFPPPRYDKSNLTAKEGDVTVTFANPRASSVPHNVVIEGNGVEKASAIAQPGQTVKVTAKDLKVGRYTFYCAVGQHRQNGMTGTLTVRDRGMLGY